MLKLIFILALISFNFSNSQTNKIEKKNLLLIDSMINNEILENKIPGAVVLVGDNREIIFHKAYGLSNVQFNRAFNINDIFRIASMTKAITALAVIKLWEKGLIDLDDPIKKYIPEFDKPGILKTYNPTDTTYTTFPAKNDITIRHLLTHTSGIGYDFIDVNPAIKSIFHKKKKTFMSNSVMCFCDEDVSIGESVKKLSKIPLHHEPGEDYTYGIGLDILGYLIEIVSDNTLDEFFRKEIFVPLEMNDTYFYLPETKSDKLVPVQVFDSGVSYNPNNQNYLQSWSVFQDNRFNVNYPVEGERKFFAGGCGLSSTISDYYNFLSIFLNDGKYKENQIIKKTTLDLIYKNQLGKKFNKGIGLVFGITQENDTWFNKGNSTGVLHWGGYWNTNFFVDPKKNIVGLIFKQTQNTNENSWVKLINIIYNSFE